MSYTALYRKFRPVSFEDVKGQDHIVTTLCNQISANRIGHAYLFCGTRGTGKTTVAKIFARAVNCETPENGSPCGHCPTCEAIANGAALNIIEIDAASNNGVDNVREIIDEVSYSPTLGRFKVYIIDEVHMLSSGAFNALLKTLEEPPEYVIFILATTEPHKIPITIHSRCQRYDFHRITIDTIQARLRTVVDEEKLSVDDRALRYIAKSGDGSMRDALSLLDQCIAFHYGETLTYDMALEVLGSVDTGVFDQIVNSMYNCDVVQTLKVLSDVVEQGRDLSQFNNDLIWYIRSVMLMKTNAGLEEVIDLNSEDMAKLKQTAEHISMEAVMRYIRILSELTSQLRYSTQKRILLEVMLIRMCTPQSDVDVDSLTERIRVVEEQVSQGVMCPPIGDIYSPQVQTETVNEPEHLAELPKALPEDVEAINNSWGQILKYLKEPLSSYMGPAATRSVSSDGKLLLVWNDCDRVGFNIDDEKKKDLLEAIRNVSGKEVEVEFIFEKDNVKIKSTYPDISRMVQAMEIVEEEEPEEGYPQLYDEEGDNT